MSILNLCNRTATVKRPTVATDGRMGQSKTWNALYSNVPVSVQPVRMSMVVESGQAVSQVTHAIYSPLSMTLRPEDRFEVDGVVYKFLALGDMAGRGVGFKYLTSQESA